jgi:hypothetical protein
VIGEDAGRLIDSAKGGIMAEVNEAQKPQATVRAYAVIEERKPAIPNVNIPAGFDFECERPPRWALRFPVGTFDDAAEGSLPEIRGLSVSTKAYARFGELLPKLFPHQFLARFTLYIAFPDGTNFQREWDNESTD